MYFEDFVCIMRFDEKNMSCKLNVHVCKYVYPTEVMYEISSILCHSDVYTQWVLVNWYSTVVFGNKVLHLYF